MLLRIVDGATTTTTASAAPSTTSSSSTRRRIPGRTTVWKRLWRVPTLAAFGYALSVLAVSYTNWTHHTAAAGHNVRIIPDDQSLRLRHEFVSHHSRATAATVAATRATAGEQPQDDDTLQLHDGRSLNRCLTRANAKHIKPYEQEWYPKRKPHFASVVFAPPSHNNHNHYNQTYYWHVIFNIGSLKTKLSEPGVKNRLRHQWMRNGIWFCDGKAAVPIGHGCPNGETLLIQCPQTDLDGQKEGPKIVTVANESYYVGDHVACYQNQTTTSTITTMLLNKYQTELGTGKIAANALLFGESIKYPRRLVEWMEYHRMIGVDHFFIYLMGPYTKEEEFALPMLPYATYIPYDLIHESNFDSLLPAFRFQKTQQMDAIVRARAMGYSWIVMTDMDEYIQFGDPHQADSTLHNLLNRLAQSPSGDVVDPRLGGISIQSTTYGTAHGEPRFPELMIDHIWRRKQIFVGERQKVIVRPGNVDYFAVHGITLGGKEVSADPAIIRLAHYHLPELGVSQTKRPIKDTSLRDVWHDKLKKRVDLIWRLMKEKYNVSDDLWSTQTSFRR
jgi:Glycosyltransferase family 92